MMLKQRINKNLNINDSANEQKEILRENLIMFSNNESIKRDSKGFVVANEVYNSQGLKVAESIYGKDEIIRQKVKYQEGKISSSICYWENGAKKEVKEYDANNNLTYSAKFNKKEEIIEESLYYTDGILYKNSKFINGKLLTEAIYSENGNKKCAYRYNNGKKISETTYDLLGNIFQETLFDLNGAVSKQDEYAENGNKKSSTTFVRGIKKSHIAYSASSNKVEKEIEYNNNGDKILEIFYCTSGIKGLERKFNPATKESEDTSYWANGNTKEITRFLNNNKTYELKCAEDGAKQEEYIYENTTTTKKEYSKYGIKETVTSRGMASSCTMYDYNGEKYHESLYKNGILTKERSYKENGRIDSEILYNNGTAVKELNYWQNGNKKNEVIRWTEDKYNIFEYNKNGILKIKKEYDSSTQIIKTELFNSTGKNVAVGYAKRFFDRFDLAICFDKKNGLLSPNSENYNIIKKLCFNIMYKTVRLV